MGRKWRTKIENTVIKLINEENEEHEKECQDLRLHVGSLWFLEPLPHAKREQVKDEQMHQYATQSGAQ